LIELFKQSPLLLLFVVSAVGYLVGSITIRGNKMGVAAVLFVGLAFGALDPDMDVPEIIVSLGLVIFIYTIGLSSGPGFFSIFEKQGLRNVFFVIGMLTLSASITVALHFLFELDAATSGGLFAGSTTNTPSLAGLLDLIENTNPGEVSNLSDHAVIGYSLSYPMGVFGTLMAIFFMRKWLKIDFKKEAAELQSTYPISEQLDRATIRITNLEMTGIPVREIYKKLDGRIVFARMNRGQETSIITWDTQFQVDDQIVLIGSGKTINEAIALLGESAKEHLSDDRRVFDVRRMFVSNPDIVGRNIASLNLNERFPVLITRINRGDMELLANSETVLEFGDRVRLLARRKDMPEVNAFFGNSYEAMSHINLLSFGLGIAMGLLLGMITFSLPGGINFKLGAAGGALIVSLVLSKWRRTGSIVWTLPHSANLTLRQFGLILLLAGIGIRSGHTFMTTLAGGSGGLLFLCGAIISTLTAFITLFVGYKLFKIPFSFLTGMVSNQPAILDYALEQAGNRLPTIGYILMLPVALITKILFVQLLYLFLG